jgi:hypothetical protein
MTIYTLNNRVLMMEKKLHDLYCYVKNNSGSTVETDPIFSDSPAFSITQTNIDTWNTTPTVPNLQQVTEQGFTTDRIIQSDSSIIASEFITSGTTAQGTIKADNLTNNRTYELPNISGTFALVSDIPVDTGPQIIRTNVSSYNLVPTKKTILVTFTGTTTTFNLPLVAPNVGTIILLYNGGTGGVTITGNVADGNVIIDGGVASPTSVLTVGSPITIFNDGFNWIKKP